METLTAITAMPGLGQALWFTPEKVDELNERRKSVAAANHAYFEARLKAERIYRDGPTSKRMPFADNKERDDFEAAFCAAMTGLMDDDTDRLQRAADILEYAFVDRLGTWWQPSSHLVLFTLDAVWSHLDDGRRSKLLRACRELFDASPNAKLGGNIGMGHRKAMICMGILEGDTDLIHEALEDAERGAKVLIQRHQGEEGFWNESSLHYHIYAMKQFVEILAISRYLNHNFFEHYCNRVVKGCEVIFEVLDYDLKYSGVGDSFEESLPIQDAENHSVFEMAASLFDVPHTRWYLSGHHRSGVMSLAFGPAQLDGGKAPSRKSVVFPRAGYAVLRGGRESKSESCAFLNFGAHGGWHGHEDALSLELRAFGQEMVCERRRAANYVNRIHYDWHRRTAAHSTVVVDRRDQEKPETSGELISYIDRSDVSAICAEHPQAYPGIRYRRSIVRVNGYIIDHFLADSPIEHEYRYLLHAKGRYSCELPLKTGQVLGSEGGFSHFSEQASGCFEDGFRARLEQGSWRSNRWTPGVTGMDVQITDEGPGRVVLAQCPDTDGVHDCLILEKRAKSVRFLNVLLPFQNDEPKGVTLQSYESESSFDIRIEHDEFVEWIHYSPGQCVSFRAKDFEVTGEFVYLKARRREGIIDLQHQGINALTYRGSNLI